MILYSNKDPENLSDFLMQFKVAFDINLFLLSSNHGSPYKSMSFLLLSSKDSKLSSPYFILFIRSKQCCEKWWQCNR